MDWNTIRQKHPNQWLVVEANSAHTDTSGKRIITDLNIIEFCADGKSAFEKYRDLHLKNHTGEYYYLHTNREKLDIEETSWVGIRKQSATAPA